MGMGKDPVRIAEDAKKMRTKRMLLSQRFSRKGGYFIRGYKKRKSSPMFVRTNQNINLMSQEHALGFCEKR